MRWTPGGRSGSIEGRRGQGVPLGGIRLGGGSAGLGLGGLILLFVLSIVFKTDFFRRLAVVRWGRLPRQSTGPIQPAMLGKRGPCSPCHLCWMMRRTLGSGSCRKPEPSTATPS